MQSCERRIIATPHVHIAHVREKNLPPAGSGELISRKLRSPSHQALSNHPFHPYPPPDLFTPHPNQTACSYDLEFVLPMTIMLASITNSLNIFLGVDMYTELVWLLHSIALSQLQTSRSFRPCCAGWPPSQTCT